MIVVKISLKALSNSVKKGLKQGFDIWRHCAKQYKQLQMDIKYEELGTGISQLIEEKNSIKYRVAMLREHNNQLRDKCRVGQECG